VALPLEEHHHVWIGWMVAIASIYETCKWVLKVICTSFPGVREASGQKTWKDLGLLDIRDVAVASTAEPVQELPGAADFDIALRQVALGFGLREGMGIWSTSVAWPPNDKSSHRLLLSEELLDIVLPQAGEKRSHPSADIQVINGVPNADYCHLKAVDFALLGSFFWHEPALCQLVPRRLHV
jgi:hypothetical protein